jgi:hypothetical protein
MALCEVKSVTQKYLTRRYLCNTVIDMANTLSKDKQIAVIGTLAKGSFSKKLENFEEQLPYTSRITIS